jgi:hypothetical protein
MKKRKTARPACEELYLMFTRASQVKLQNEGGTTPPLADKRKDDWRIYLHFIGGFLHRENRAIIILRAVHH